jgi:hypothetical protein
MFATIQFKILSRVLVTKTGFGLVIEFINNPQVVKSYVACSPQANYTDPLYNPQVVTAINYNTVTDLHTLKSLHANLFSLSAIVFTYV